MKRTVVIVSIVAILLLVSACGQSGVPTNESATSGNVTDQPTAPVINETPPAAPAAPPVVETPPVSPPVAPAAPPAEPAVNLSGCPLISPELVQEKCARDTLPTVTVENASCVFHFGSDMLIMNSVSASKSDYQDWLDAYYTSVETFELKPMSARAEIHGVEYYAWFTGSKLITAESTGPLACKGDHIALVVGAVDTKASLGTATDALKMGIVADPKKMDVGPQALFQMLMLKYTLSGTLVPDDGSNASGTVKATLNNGVFNLLAEFKGLQPLDDNHYYAGWLAKKGVVWNVVSTGKAQVMDDALKDVYLSGTDLTDHPYFFLTLEEVGKGGPGPRVLEGQFG